MSTPTPRTDAAVQHPAVMSGEAVLATFARTLERELDQVTAEIATLRPDKVRLDYLLRGIRVGFGEPRCLTFESIPYPDTTLDARSAIDAARAAHS